MHSRSLDPWRHEHVFLGAAAYKKRLGRVAGLSHVTIEVAAQRWLYSGIASGLGEFAGGDPRAIFAAVCAAVLFGAIHALMPGHGKTVLVSYHLGQPGKLRDGLTNGAILAVTHVGLAVVLVLAGFAVISKVFAFGGRTPQFELASGVLIVAIGGFLLWRSLKSDHGRSSGDGKSLAFVTGLIPCPLTTFIMSYGPHRGAPCQDRKLAASGRACA
jgi:ABC-type nickel/cobalt efflux system permease component RcnA